MEAPMRELIERLRDLGGLCHITSVQNYRKIRDSGFIKPNHGGLPFSWEQSKDSCCFKLGAVSLFDFKSPDSATLFDELSQLKINAILIREFLTAVIIVIDSNRLTCKALQYTE